MPSSDLPHWLRWAREMRSIAEAGLAYSRDPYDRERFTRLQQLAAEATAQGAGLDEARVLRWFQLDGGYVTPKIDVRAVVLRGDAVLMVRESADGGWTFPGGWVEPGESLRESVEKEVLEESGLRVRAARLLAIHERDRHGHPPLAHAVWKFFVQCDELDGALRVEGPEILDAGWFREDALPPLSLGRLVPEQVARMLQLARDPGAAAEFD